jgi:ubiquinone/menaquinone biosynthesis C-methylase UbiE
MFHTKGPTFWELAVQALSSTERGYDLLAPKFDYTPFRTPESILERVGAHLGTLGPFGAGLDICCGTGAALRMLRPHCRDAVVGLDVSAGMLAEARVRTANSIGTAPVHLVRADALAMPFDAAFDIAVCFGAFGHILAQDEERFVAEVARVLKPGGRFVFVTTYLPPLWSPSYWLARGFNGAMRLRNWLWSPPFIMYYLTFLLPEAGKLLEAHGFEVAISENAFEFPWNVLRLVTATKAVGINEAGR